MADTAALARALTAIDVKIETLAGQIANPASYSVEGLSVVRAKLTEAIKARRELKALIDEAADDEGVYLETELFWGM